MQQMIVHPLSSPFSATLNFDGDKSISHRALIFAALSQKKVKILHLLESEDVMCTAQCLRQLGVKIEKQNEEWCVEGVGMHGLQKPSDVLYCGNSGTTLRLLMGVLSAQNFECKLTGDASLNKRPLKRVIDPLSMMGARFKVEGEGTAERILSIEGAKLRGIHYHSPIASAQVKSAILLAGLWADAFTTVTEPSLSRNHTEKFFELLSIPYSKKNLSVSVSAVKGIDFPDVYTVPADFSSAAFFIVAALISKGSVLQIENVGLNPTRTGLLQLLTKMSANIELSLKSEKGEESGNLKISSSELKAGQIQAEQMASLIDEIPIFAIAAAKAQGTSIVKDAQELKVKESNRLVGIENIYKTLKVNAQFLEDGFSVEGPQAFSAGQMNAGLDHRLAMSLAIAGLVADGPVCIDSADSVKSSFPSFWDKLKSLGVKIEEKIV